MICDYSTIDCFKIYILNEIFTLALDLKINQFRLDMNDVNDLNINI